MTATLTTPTEETAVPSPDAPLVLPFRDPRCQEVELTGGKGASLATMTAEGLPVPPGFVITSAAFAAAVDEEALRGGHAPQGRRGRPGARRRGPAAAAS